MEDTNGYKSSLSQSTDITQPWLQCVSRSYEPKQPTAR